MIEQELPEPIRRARKFARLAHGYESQVYGPGVPYEKHLDDVYQVLLDFGETSEDLLCAAYLHDVVEDTEIFLGQIRAYFGDRVMRLVDAVTNERGKNRKERNQRTYPKTRKDVQAVRLKLADRIANVEAAMETRPDLYKMYREEQPAFEQALYRENEWELMWDRLRKALV